MRRLLLLLPLLALLHIAPAHAAVASGQHVFGFCQSTTVHSGNTTANCASNAKTMSFTFTSGGTGRQVLFGLSCAAGSATPSAVTLTAIGWTTTQIGAIGGSTTAGFSAAFKAYSPNTSAATFTATWTVATNGCGTTANQFQEDITSEFSGGDATNFVDAVSGSGTVSTGTTGGCAAANVTPVANNDGIWYFCQDTITAVTGAYTQGANDTLGDWSEWKILSGGAGVAQSSGFTSSGAFTVFGVAIKPAATTVATMPPAVY